MPIMGYTCATSEDIHLQLGSSWTKYILFYINITFSEIDGGSYFKILKTFPQLVKNGIKTISIHYSFHKVQPGSFKHIYQVVLEIMMSYLMFYSENT